MQNLSKYTISFFDFFDMFDGYINNYHIKVPLKGEVVMCKLLFCLLLVWFTLKQLVEALSDHTQMEDTEIDQETHKTEKKD